MARPRPNRITAHIHAAVERIGSICDRSRDDIRARLLEHIDEHPNSPWSYAHVARLERTLTEMYQQWGASVNAVFSDFLPREYQAGYERAKAELKQSGVWQNITGGPDLRRIQNALDSVYNNVALRTDKMTFDHIRQLRNFSAKVFRESTITGETQKQVSDRLENEALQVPGFQFTDIAGRKWSHKSYFEMLARTELMNGARDSYEQECAEQGYNIMLLSVSGHCCDACAKYEGQYFSIGPNKYGLPTKDDLEAEGVFHPNCTHSYSAFPDYIIEREFGKTEKGSSPSGPSGHYEAAGTTTENDEIKTSYTDIVQLEELSSNGDDRIYIGVSRETENLSHQLECSAITRETTIHEVLKEVNPKYKGDPKTDLYSINCQRAVYAYEARMRGLDVVAKPALDLDISKDPFSSKYLRVMKGQQYFSYPSSVKLMERISNLPDGARAIVKVDWNNTPYGHTFIAERINGKTILIDPQTGKDGSNYLDRAKKDGSFFFSRIDNLDFDVKLLQETCEARNYEDS